jgi:sugar phosphate isomerase/epimerase
MRFAICNEMFKGWPHDRVARTVATLGYHGVELAPFTLSADPVSLSPTERRDLKAVFSAAGLEIMGLHWLLAGTTGMSITQSDPAVQERTEQHMERLIGLSHDLGAGVMVFGSPQQRTVGEGNDPAAARERVVGMFRRLAPIADSAGVVICFEPLTPRETDFITTMTEGVALVEAVGHVAFQLHLDVKAMCGGESRPAPDVIRKEGGRHLRHFHANDPNLLGPGMGDYDFAPVAAALRDIGYDRWVSVETFVDGPGPEEIARQSIITLKRTLGGDHAR